MSYGLNSGERGPIGNYMGLWGGTYYGIGLTWVIEKTFGICGLLGFGDTASGSAVGGLGRPQGLSQSPGAVALSGVTWQVFPISGLLG